MTEHASKAVTAKPEIAPCRWCNPEFAGLSPRVNTANGTQHWVFCPECGTHGPCGIGEVEAIDRWNTLFRPSLPVKEAAKAAAREIIMDLIDSEEGTLSELTPIIAAIICRHFSLAPFEKLAPREMTIQDDVPKGYSPISQYAWKAGWNACVGYIIGNRELPHDIAAVVEEVRGK